MGFLIALAFVLILVAIIIHQQDRIKPQIRPLSRSAPTQQRQRKKPEEPISVDEFYDFRWEVHRCKDPIQQQEQESGDLCDYCGSSGVGSF